MVISTDGLIELFDGPASSTLPWNIHDIATTRSRSPDKLLLFDRLLDLAGIDQVLYPPKDHLGLRQLLHAIDKSETFDGLKRCCLVYYLLCEYRDGREDRFARKRGVPSIFRRATKGYWLLDHGELQPGVKQLCAPAVEPNFVSAILQILAADVSTSSLVIAFVKHAGLTERLEGDDLQVYYTSLVKAGRLDDFVALERQQRGLGDADDQSQQTAQPSAQQILHHLCHDVFTSGPQTSAMLERMLDFPFDADEEAHVFEWIQKAVSRVSQYQAKTIALICDWASSRLIACGRYIEAITLLHSSLSSLRSSPALLHKVNGIIDRTTAALPSVQRSALDLMLAAPASDRPGAASYATVAKSTDAATVPGNIAQVAWLPSPLPSYLPTASTLSQAQHDDAARKEALAGGPRLDRATNLPLSASGVLRDTTSVAVARKTARSDPRIALLTALRKTETAGDASMATASPAKDGRGAPRDSPGPGPRIPSSGRKLQTVYGFGSTANTGPVTALDFTEQLKRFAAQRSPAGQTSHQSPRLQPAPSGSERKAGRAHAVNDGQKADSTAAQANQTAPSSSRKLPPGALMLPGVDDDASDDDALAQAEADDNVPDIPAPSNKRETRARPSNDGETKKSTARTVSQRDPPEQSREPRKKGKTGSESLDKPANSRGNNASNSRQTRRSMRLASTGPEDNDEDDSIVEDSMIGRRQGARRSSALPQPRRRRP